ncbi:L-seryl-tRNA(Ser) seleniumtransferase [Myxococcaceae bacterium]|nr:L-seryl-tRNA(Ser) seleniumtransferase [Myxococcaceae bacterium]
MDPGGEVKRDPRTRLPQADRLIRELREELPEVPVWAATAAARSALSRARELLAHSPERPISLPGLLESARAEAFRLVRGHPRRVVNATGVVLHTNLGRAPLAPGAAEAAAAAASAYGDLELDLALGSRGDRLGAVAVKLALLAGAEAGHAVNNGAAALLLALDTLARGREVVISRGELVEIGGSFRIPEIVERAGVRLREVGTTNRTHLRDYEAAIGPETAAIVKVHRSNFEIRGFTAEVGLDALAGLARARGLPLVEDLGSGSFVDASVYGLPESADARARLREGADLVLFSGDKLLGGPQAGLLVGSAALVARLRRNPLDRALRLDKLRLAALDWTLAALLEGRGDELPVLGMLGLAVEALEVRAVALARRIVAASGGALAAAARRERAPVGGGSLPGIELETWVVRITDPSGALGAEDLARGLRAAPVPVLPRIHDAALWVDVRTLLPGDEEDVISAVSAVLSGAAR